MNKKLKELEIGDTIYLIDKNADLFTYDVVDTKTLLYNKKIFIASNNNESKYFFVSFTFDNNNEYMKVINTNNDKYWIENYYIGTDKKDVIKSYIEKLNESITLSENIIMQSKKDIIKINEKIMKIKLNC